MNREAIANEREMTIDLRFSLQILRSLDRCLYRFLILIGIALKELRFSIVESEMQLNGSQQKNIQFVLNCISQIIAIIFVVYFLD